ncbi:TMEM175 family protein [Lacisediminihabitans sp. FW035]
MGDTNRAYDRFLGNGTNSDRLQFFSDAVFAIAMTLLVIDITVPTIANGPSVTQAQLDPKVWNALGAEFSQFLAYALSFAVIASNWATHHRKFALIRRFDGRLMSLNLLLLFFIAFLPFPTSLISEYGSSMPAVILYAGNVAILSLLQFSLWSYAHRHHFLDERVDLGMYRYVRRNLLPVPTVFLLSIPVGIAFGAVWSLYSWILLVPINIIVGRYEPRRRGKKRLPL